MAVKMQSYFRDVFKDLDRGQQRQRRKAAAVVRAEIKRKARRMKVTGNLEKGVYSRNGRTASFVGIKAPHAYLVEFGTKNRDGSQRAKPNPIVYTTMAEKEDEVARILSEPWAK